MSDFKSPRQITFRICLDFSRIYVDYLQRSMADFKPVMLLFDMVFVHVSRCLIFKVQPLSQGRSEGALADSFDIIARKSQNVKNFFRFFQIIF